MRREDCIHERMRRRNEGMLWTCVECGQMMAKMDCGAIEMIPDIPGFPPTIEDHIGFRLRLLEESMASMLAALRHNCKTDHHLTPDGQWGEKYN